MVGDQYLARCAVEDVRVSALARYHEPIVRPVPTQFASYAVPAVASLKFPQICQPWELRRISISSNEYIDGADEARRTWLPPMEAEISRATLWRVVPGAFHVRPLAPSLDDMWRARAA